MFLVKEFMIIPAMDLKTLIFHLNCLLLAFLSMQYVIQVLSTSCCSELYVSLMESVAEIQVKFVLERPRTVRKQIIV